MKKLTYTLLSIGFLTLVACQNNDTNKLPAKVINISATADSTSSTNSTTKPEITFTEKGHNFGPMQEGDVVEYSFKFKNTGNADLLIVSATASCGCTVPDYPKDLIKPDTEGYLKVKFDSKGKVGMFDKTVTVICNTEMRETILTISGEVLEKKN